MKATEYLALGYNAWAVSHTREGVLIELLGRLACREFDPGQVLIYKVSEDWQVTEMGGVSASVLDRQAAPTLDECEVTLSNLLARVGNIASLLEYDETADALADVEGDYDEVMYDRQDARPDEGPTAE